VARRLFGELALAIRQEANRRIPSERVFIPKANGKLRPRASNMLDRVCMTAAMLVLEPIFEADLPPEQYATVLGECQQAVVEGRSAVPRPPGRRRDGTPRTTSGSIPHTDVTHSRGRSRMLIRRRVIDQDVAGIAPLKETADRGRKNQARPRPRHAGGFRRVHPFTVVANLICAGCAGMEEARLERGLGRRIVTYVTIS